MEELQRIVIDEAISTFARLMLFVAEELEPLSPEILERDLEILDDAIEKIERCALRWRQARSKN